jgi:hypothetical protein
MLASLVVPVLAWWTIRRLASDAPPPSRLAQGRLEISPGGTDMPLFQDATTDKQSGSRVLWADSLRWRGFKRALELPDRPDLADRA